MSEPPGEWENWRWDRVAEGAGMSVCPALESFGFGRAHPGKECSSQSRNLLVNAHAERTFNPLVSNALTPPASAGEVWPDLLPPHRVAQQSVRP